MKAQREIDRLKRKWRNNPDFNTWKAEGFEDHADELKAWQEAQEAPTARLIERIKILERSTDDSLRTRLIIAVAEGRSTIKGETPESIADDAITIADEIVARMAQDI